MKQTPTINNSAATEIGTTIATIVPDEIPLLPAKFQNDVMLVQ
jgi:hypothetical protein